MFEIFSNPAVWGALVTLTFLEIVLGVDNIIFISISANKLPEAEQPKARNIGLILAMVFRVVLLFGISYLIAMQDALIHFDNEWIKGGFSGQSLILIAGGLFLLYKSTSEIHHKIEGENEEKETGKKKTISMTKVITQITIINIVFSFDSILTAVGMTNGVEGALTIMIISVVLSGLIMMAFAGPVGRFVNNHPSIQMLGLSFLIMIGFMLIAEGAHLGHLVIVDTPVGIIPKGYMYFAISFSLFVEFLNIKMRKTKVKV